MDKKISIAMIMAITTLVTATIAATSFVTSAYADASPEANTVAQQANNNGETFAGCKSGSTASECAKLTSAPGPFTSNLARDVNGPTP